jgi:sterol desaturase/sphingolipid hydroxylase (fatty acid hydroxylase superfamily)
VARGEGVVSGWLVAHDAVVRAGAFVAVLGALYVLQGGRPCRGDGRRSSRQLVNLAMVVVDTLLVRLVCPVLTVGFAVAVAARGVGLFNATTWPAAIEVVLAMLALDLVIYWQHRILHRVPILWRAHRVHHSDLAFDVTLGVRFHPFEIVLSQLVKLAAVAALGAAPIAVLLFEIVLQAGSLFTHTDVALPAAVDAILRRWIVTPSVHRVHHSIERDETDSNFGFNLIWWDRLFGTYRARPRRPEHTMPIGIPEFRDPAEQRLLPLLLQPFRGAPVAMPALSETPHA